MGLSMSVPVRVDVCRRAAQEFVETLELTLEVLPNRVDVTQVEASLVLAEDIPVQTDRQLRIFVAQGHGLLDGMSRDHEAGACHDATPVRLDDTAVDPGRVPEIVGVDDEKPGHVTRLRVPSGVGLRLPRLRTAPRRARGRHD